MWSNILLFNSKRRKTQNPEKIKLKKWNVGKNKTDFIRSYVVLILDPTTPALESKGPRRTTLNNESHYDYRAMIRSVKAAITQISLRCFYDIFI